MGVVEGRCRCLVPPVSMSCAAVVSVAAAVVSVAAAVVSVAAAVVSVAAAVVSVAAAVVSVSLTTFQLIPKMCPNRSSR